MARREILAVLVAAGGAGIAAALFGMTSTSVGAAVSAECFAGLSPTDLGWDPERGEYVLPDLPYAYDAIEPAIDAETMRLHHSIHHAGYVRGLNAALAALASIRAGDGAVERVQAISRDLAFHGSGHLLHVLFWRTLRPAGSDASKIPTTTMRDAIERDFGSVADFEEQFVATALSVEGSGWAILAHEPIADRLMIMGVEKHQDLTIHGPDGMRPLLACDVWEHAYYLRYQNRREAYVRAWLGVVDWVRVDEMLNERRMAH